MSITGSHIIVLVTVPENADCNKLASTLVREELAACVNILPLENSIFFWEGKVQSEREKLLMIKTKIEKFNKLVTRIKELHPYTVPEIIGVPIIVGNREYLKWVEDVVS